MRRVMVTVLATVAAVLILLIGVGLAVILSGGYDVAATTEHSGITKWALSTLQERGVRAQAADVEVALPSDSASLHHGFVHFHAMCVQCHGAPGLERGEAGQGMNPLPPHLEEEVHEWSDAELFWITKNGIRLAGMPAFGVTHSDAELSSIVAFVRRLERMTEEEYAAMVTALAAAGGEAASEHTHAPGTPAHQH